MLAAKRGFLAEMLAIPEQIHSSAITCINTPGDYLASDGLITDNPEIILSLEVADCVPMYLYEPNSQIIGLVHCGWRGTSEGIVSTTIRKMLEMGANEKEVRLLLGPSIGFCCYEVEEEVADKFNNKATEKMENGKWKIGLHEEICLQLTEMGIHSSNIQTSDICTFESADFQSYRRDGFKARRMFAFMRLRS